MSFRTVLLPGTKFSNISIPQPGLQNIPPAKPPALATFTTANHSILSEGDGQVEWQDDLGTAQQFSPTRQVGGFALLPFVPTGVPEVGLQGLLRAR